MSALAVWKFRLCRPGETCDVPMPLGARTLRVAIQDGAITLWALVGSEGVNEVRRFAVYGTGDRSIASDSNYIGTVMNGPFVWHVFEESSR